MNKQKIRLQRIRKLESALLGATPSQSAKIVNKLVDLKAKVFREKP